MVPGGALQEALKQRRTSAAGGGNRLAAGRASAGVYSPIDPELHRGRSEPGARWDPCIGGALPDCGHRDRDELLLLRSPCEIIRAGGEGDGDGFRLREPLRHGLRMNHHNTGLDRVIEGVRFGSGMRYG